MRGRFSLAVLVFAVAAALLSAGPVVAQDLSLPGTSTADEPAAKPAAEPVQVGRDRVEDADIEAMLRGVFAEVDELSEVQVTVRTGVVHLRGTAESTEAEDKAVALARRLEGVLYVDNDLEPPGEAEEQIAPALEKVTNRLEAIAVKLPLLALAAVVVLAGYLLARAIRGSGPQNVSKRNPLVRGLYRQIAGAGVLVGSLLLALEVMQATALLGAVLGAAGVLGLTLGFALRDIAENYLSSILLSLRRPFDPSDLIRVGEHEGRVMRLTTRDTTLMTLEGNAVRLPNSTVFKSVIVNYTRNPLRQFSVTAGVAIEQSLLHAQQVGIEALRNTPGVTAEPPPFARVEAFGSSYMEVRFFGWVDQRDSDWWKVRSEAVRHLKGAFEQASVDLPAPSLRIEGAALPDVMAARPSAPATEDLTQQAHDVAQDDHLQRQMDQDQAEAEEPDLLEPESDEVDARSGRRAR